MRTAPKSTGAKYYETNWIHWPGVMGGGIAGTLLKVGYELIIWSRNPDQGWREENASAMIKAPELQANVRVG